MAVCMQGRGCVEQRAITRELKNLLLILIESPESQPKRGRYVANMPRMVRMAMHSRDDKDMAGKRIPDFVLQFPASVNLTDVQTGLYTCKICLELSNASWKLTQADFIEGRGPCTVSGYLYNCCFIQPIPLGSNLIGRFGSGSVLESMKKSFWSMFTSSESSIEGYPCADEENLDVKKLTRYVMSPLQAGVTSPKLAP